MSDKHLSTQFDAELSRISTRVLEMGGLVEAQVSAAVESLANLNEEGAAQVLKNEERVNQIELEIDRELSSIIARRQPTARDLRLLIGVSKTIGNLERVGDEAARIARTTHRLIRTSHSTRLFPTNAMTLEASLATASLRRSLDAFARLDVTLAMQVIRQDNEIDAEFDGLMRKLITYMMEDPRTIGASIDLVFVAKALERVGDHAKNLAEQVIYIAKGADVRHTPLDGLDSAVS